MTVPGTPPDLLDDLRRALAGRYDVDRQLGAGGMGSVFLGRDVTLDRPVAIKVIAPELAAAPTIRQRFLQEARTVARLRHPNIVAMYAAGEADGTLYAVMEYVPGESLRARLDRDRGLDGAAGMAAVRDLARALAYAHEHGVVHRDVKPENVLLDAESGRAMLTDFGVAALINRGADGNPGLTGTGFVLGSPRYMSPEQAAGERELDGRSDQYALGLVAYEMFAGAPAIDAPNAASAIVKQLTEVPPPLTARNAAVPAALSDVIARALAKVPEERWESAAAMADAMDVVIAESSGAHASGGRALAGSAAWRRPGAPSRTRRRLLGLAAVLLLAAVPAAWYASRGRLGVPSDVEPRKSYLVTPFDVLSGDPQVAWLREGSVSMLSMDLARWTDLRVVDYERSLDLLRDANLEGDRNIGLEAAQAMARKAGVWTVVMGQVQSPGDSLVVTARLFDVASGRKLDETTRAARRGADPRPLYDALTRDLLDLAGVGGGDSTGNLTAATTSSLAAYRAYLDGTRALNRWQLARADSLFARAIEADSTFAFAYYKRALGQGWNIPGTPEQLALMRHAEQHAGRLPARDRELVSAYADLVAGLEAERRLDGAGAAALLGSAQAKYAAAVARDSTHAEAWYGLGDAYYHHHPDGFDGPVHVANMSRALRAFNRTLALDSTFHLAYSHKLDMYRQAAGNVPTLVLDGDSLRRLPTEADRRAFGAERLAQARARAQDLAMRDARAWIAADPVPQAYRALALLLINAGRFDSAATVLAEASTRPSARAPSTPYLLAAVQLRRDPLVAVATLRTALKEATPEQLAADSPGEVFEPILGAAGAAAAVGSTRELEQTARLVRGFEKVGAKSSAMAALHDRYVRGWVAASELAMGVPPERVRGVLDSTYAYADTLSGEMGRAVRTQGWIFVYIAYLATREPRYLETLRRWQPPNAPAVPEIDVLAALAAGDRPAAERAARLFPSVDSARTTPGSLNLVRWVARAEALAQVGDTRRALAAYELLDPTRFSSPGPAEPGWGMYSRSFLARGQLYEQLGEREKAAAAYERFVALWRDADPVLQPQVRRAREALARVRDAGPAGRPVGG